MNLRLDKCIGLVLLCSTLSGTLSCAKEPSTRPSVNKRQVSGAALFKEQCDVCHSNGKTGGCLGPVLAGEGKRRGRAFIESRISNAPREIAKFESVYGQPELMPHPRVSPQMAKTLASYVSTLPAVPLKVSGHAPAASGGLDIASAAKRLMQSGHKDRSLSMKSPAWLAIPFMDSEGTWRRRLMVSAHE